MALESLLKDQEKLFDGKTQLQKFHATVPLKQQVEKKAESQSYKAEKNIECLTFFSFQQQTIPNTDLEQRRSNPAKNLRFQVKDWHRVEFW